MRLTLPTDRNWALFTTTDSQKSEILFMYIRNTNNTALFYAVLCCAVLCCTVLYCTVPYSIVLCCAVLCCAALCGTVRYCAVLYCAALCCTVHHCFIECPLVRQHMQNAYSNLEEIFQDDNICPKLLLLCKILKIPF